MMAIKADEDHVEVRVMRGNLEGSPSREPT